MVAEAVLLKWSDLSKPFDIEADASDYQLGSVLKQAGNPIAFFSRKLTPPRRKYTTIMKELLSIVETLSEFRSLLKGNEIRVQTDHNVCYSHQRTRFNVAPTIGRLCSHIHLQTWLVQCRSRFFISLSARGGRPGVVRRQTQ